MVLSATQNERCLLWYEILRILTLYNPLIYNYSCFGAIVLFIVLQTDIMQNITVPFFHSSPIFGHLNFLFDEVLFSALKTTENSSGEHTFEQILRNFEKSFSKILFKLVWS